MPKKTCIKFHGRSQLSEVKIDDVLCIYNGISKISFNAKVSSITSKYISFKVNLAPNAPFDVDFNYKFDISLMSFGNDLPFRLFLSEDDMHVNFIEKKVIDKIIENLPNANLSLKTLMHLVDILKVELGDELSKDVRKNNIQE